MPNDDEFTLDGIHETPDPDAPAEPGIPAQVPDVYTYPTPIQVPPYGAA